VLGSLHEERRLRAAYSGAYERYRRAVPFLFPGPPRG
jgi:protein-S-isoprenylcysteine O-methyltransferase Ste14